MEGASAIQYIEDDGMVLSEDDGMMLTEVGGALSES